MSSDSSDVDARISTAGQRSAFFDEALRDYSAQRGLSDRQLRILKLYLRGKTDKDIAGRCDCSEATIYEHWHRMARKMGGSYKSDVIADFHRFLGAAQEGTPGPVAIK